MATYNVYTVELDENQRWYDDVASIVVIAEFYTEAVNYALEYLNKSNRCSYDIEDINVAEYDMENYHGEHPTVIHEHVLYW